jgi:hypothetical protein
MPMTSRATARSHARVGILPLAHAVGAIGILLATLGGFRSFSIEAQVILAATTVVLVSCAALLLVNATGGGGGLARWRLGPWFLAWGALAYGAASYGWVVPQQGPPSMIHRESVVAACYLFAVATVVWTAGYLIGVPGKWAKTATLPPFVLGKTTAQLKDDSATPWILYSVGTAARVSLAVLNGGIGYLVNPSSAVTSAAAYTQLLTSLSTLATFGLAMASYRFFARSRNGGGFPLIMMLAAEVAAGAVLGAKETFLVAVLAVVMPYGLHRGRLPLKGLAATAAVFLLIVLPFNQAYRSVLRDGGRVLTMGESITAASQVFGHVIEPDSASGTLIDSSGDAIARLRLIDNVALIVQKTPDVIAYRSPTEYLYAPVVGLIPRAVWPGKPILVGGYKFSQQYYNFPSSVYSASAVTTLGDLYRHGGWLTVIVGSLVLGAVVRMFDKLFNPETDHRALFFVLAFFPTIVKSEMDSVELLISFPALAFAAIVGVRFAAGRAGGYRQVGDRSPCDKK